MAINKWSRFTSSTSFSARNDAVGFVFDGNMWILGGYDGVNYLDDVWNSSDGIVWTEIVAHAGFPVRNEAVGFVFDGKMWIIGGHDGVNYLDDVWNSSDGIVWTRATSHAAFPVRNNAVGFAFDGKMWIIGGDSGGSYLNDVWNSSDGIVWTQSTSHAAFSVRKDAVGFAFDGKMWITTGYGSGSYLNDVWNSSDGITWTQSTDHAAFPVRKDAVGFVFDSKMWILGGYGGVKFLSDVWNSSDGITWTQSIDHAAFPARKDAVGFAFDGKMWITTGFDGTSYLNDVWSLKNVPTVQLKQSKYSKFYFPYQEYEIIYDGVSLGYSLSGIGIIRIPVEVPISYANDLADRILIDTVYIIDCEIGIVNPETIASLNIYDDVQVFDIPEKTMYFNDVKSRPLQRTGTRSKTLRIKLKGASNNDGVDNIFFFDATAVVGTIIEAGKEQALTMSIQFEVHSRFLRSYTDTDYTKRYGIGGLGVANYFSESKAFTVEDEKATIWNEDLKRRQKRAVLDVPDEIDLIAFPDVPDKKDEGKEQ